MALHGHRAVAGRSADRPGRRAPFPAPRHIPEGRNPPPMSPAGGAWRHLYPGARTQTGTTGAGTRSAFTGSSPLPRSSAPEVIMPMSSRVAGS